MLPTVSDEEIRAAQIFTGATFALWLVIGYVPGDPPLCQHHARIHPGDSHLFGCVAFVAYHLRGLIAAAASLPRCCRGLAAAVLAAAALAKLAGAGHAETPSWAVLPGVGPQDHRVIVDPNQPPWRAVGRVQTELGGRCTRRSLIGPRTVVQPRRIACFLRRPMHYIQPSSRAFRDQLCVRRVRRAFDRDQLHRRASL